MLPEQRLLAGWASAEITPTLPCWMGGYAARTERANAVHDALYVHVLALGSMMEPFILLLHDLVAVDRELVTEVRRQIHAILPGATVWSGATHTHSGPDIIPFLARSPDTLSSALREQIATRAFQATLEAIERMHPVHLAWASGTTSGIASNRDHPEKTEALNIDLLCLYDNAQDRSPSAIFASFPCHPTILSATNLEISADLPGAFRRHLHTLFARNRGNTETWIALASGAAGDISTRHTRQGQGFSELARLGALLAQQAYDIILQASPLQATAPTVQRQQVELTLKTIPSVETLQEQRRIVQGQMQAAQQVGNSTLARTLETTLQGIDAQQNLAQRRHENHLEIAVARMGALALVAIPGELYHSLGVTIQQAGEHVLLLGYTNGYNGYLPTKDTYTTLDYEALISPFAPGCGELIRDTAIELLTH